MMFHDPDCLLKSSFNIQLLQTIPQSTRGISIEIYKV
jgi:hypothetical protein